MQTNDKTDTRGIALYNSDTDDWTLVSPATSCSSGSRGSTSPDTSPTRSPSGRPNRASHELPPIPATSPSGTPIVDQSTLSSHKSLEEALSASCSKDESQTKTSSDSSSMTALATSDISGTSEQADDADDESDGLTEVNLDENGVATIREKQMIVNVQAEGDTSDDDEEVGEEAQESSFMRLASDQTGKPIDESLCGILKTDETIARKLSGCGEKLRQILEAHRGRPGDPSNHAYTELKLLNEELADCIEQENPLMRELAHWRTMDSKELRKYRTMTNTRPFRGLVCYENEVKWRKRFNYLKTEFNFDLRKIIRQIKRRLTNDILVEHHPSTPFELVLNQVEYLDHVEQRRKDRALEKLKAENLDLLRRLNNRSSAADDERDAKKAAHHEQHHHQSHHRHHHQIADKDGDSRGQPSMKSMVILESENLRLRRELESLRARLGEKAGTIYIKQSIELEKCERENNAYRQFSQDIADDLGKNLRAVSQERNDLFTHMTTNGKDSDSIGTKLDATRHLSNRLGDEVAKLVAKNHDLEKELVETRMLKSLTTREPRELARNGDRTKNQSESRPVVPSRQEPDRAFVPNSLHCVRPEQTNKQVAGVPDFVPVEPMEEWLDQPMDIEPRRRLAPSISDLQKAIHNALRISPQPPLPPTPPLSPSSSSASLLSASSSDHREHNNGRSQHKHHQDRHSRKRHSDTEHARLSSLKRLSKPNKSSLMANYYKKDSLKNCKNSHKRDEL